MHTHTHIIWDFLKQSGYSDNSDINIFGMYDICGEDCACVNVTNSKN